MPIMALNEVWETKAYCFAIDQVGINIRHWRVTLSVGNPDDITMVPLFSAAIAPLYKPLMGAAASYYGASLRRIRPSVANPVNSQSGAGAGTGALELLPRQVSGIITLRTIATGRKGRGRVYVPFPSEGLNDAPGAPSAAYVTALGTLAAYYSNAHSYTSGGMTVELTPVIYHRLTQTFDDVNGFRANARWATQRRRGAYGRQNQVPF